MRECVRESGIEDVTIPVLEENEKKTLFSKE